MPFRLEPIRLIRGLFGVDRFAVNCALLAALGVGLTGCPPPSTDIQSTPTSLTLRVLAVTAPNPDQPDRITRKVYLNWNEVPGAAKYELNSESSTRPLSTASDRSFIDKDDLEQGKEYSYFVRALDAGNTEKIKSETVKVKVLPHFINSAKDLDATPAEIAPGSFRVKSRQPILKWGSVEGASGYYVKFTTRDGDKESLVFAALTDTTTIDFGNLPLRDLVLPGFDQVGDGASLKGGYLYKFKVIAIGADAKTLKEAKAIDVGTEGSALVEVSISN